MIKNPEFRKEVEMLRRTEAKMKMESRKYSISQLEEKVLYGL